MSSSGLDISTDMAHMQRAWLAQRVAWVVIALVVLAALLGVFGGEGPLSRAVAGEEGSDLWVEYDRLARYGLEGTVDIHVRPTASNGALQFALPQAYLEGFQVRQIVPEPQDAAIVGDQVVYTVAVSPSEEPAVITLQLIPTQIGSANGVVMVQGIAEQPFQQYVFP